MGDHVLDPGWTTWHKRVLYSVYDITPLLKKGPNAVGMMLGQGWFKNRIGLVQLQIELEGGARVQVLSDTTWKTATGPIVDDSLYNGETYDARLETPGWDRPGYDASAWQAATIAEAPKGVLSTQTMPPIRVTGDIQPLKISSPRPGVFVYDMGQNFSGVVRLKVRGPRGATVRLRHAELLYDDGTLNVENLRAARATDTYTLRGDGEDEIYQPRFTYHGFRYVELTGFPGTPKLDTVLGRRVHSDVAPTGGFACSKPVAQPVAAHHRLGHPVQPGIGPHGLQPARRTHGLDGRCPPLFRERHDELRHAGVLRELRPQHPRQPGDPPRRLRL